MQTLSLFLSIGATLFSIIASLIKGSKNIISILIFYCLSNFSMAMSYVVLGGENINGSVSCFIGAAACLINSLYNSKEKDVPLWISAIYAVSFTAVNIWLGGITVGCAIAIIACLCFVMSVVQKTGKMFRVWSVSNSVLWCTYDIVQQAYQPLLTHVILLLFFILSIIVNDRKSKNTSEETK